MCLPHLHVTCDGFEVETVLNVRAAKAGFKIVEVPSYEQDRIHGLSNLNAWRDGRRVLKTIMRERVLAAARAERRLDPAVTPSSERIWERSHVVLQIRWLRLVFRTSG